MQKYFSRGRWQVQSRKKLLSHVCNAYCTLTTLQLASLDVWLPCDEDWLVLLVPPATAPPEPQHVREVDHDDATEEDDVHYHLKNKIVDKGASQG